MLCWVKNKLLRMKMHMQISGVMTQRRAVHHNHNLEVLERPNLCRLLSEPACTCSFQFNLCLRSVLSRLFRAYLSILNADEVDISASTAPGPEFSLAFLRFFMIVKGMLYTTSSDAALAFMSSMSYFTHQLYSKLGGGIDSTCSSAGRALLR